MAIPIFNRIDAENIHESSSISFQDGNVVILFRHKLDDLMTVMLVVGSEDVVATMVGMHDNLHYQRNGTQEGYEEFLAEYLHAILKGEFSKCLYYSGRNRAVKAQLVWNNPKFRTRYYIPSRFYMILDRLLKPSWRCETYSYVSFIENQVQPPEQLILDR